MKKCKVYYDNNSIYPLADELVCCFSEYLESKGIMFINEDTDEHQLLNKNAICGEDFRILQDMVQTVLNGRMK